MCVNINKTSPVMPTWTFSFKCIEEESLVEAGGWEKKADDKIRE